MRFASVARPKQLAIFLIATFSPLARSLALHTSPSAQPRTRRDAWRRQHAIARRDCEARAHAHTVVGRHTWDAASLSAHAPRLRDGGGGKAHCEETTRGWRGSGGQGGKGARARRGWARTYRRHARGARPGRSCPRSNREKRPRARGPSRNSRGLLRPSPRRFRALADSECFAPPDETSMRTSAASISAFVPARPGFGARRELEPVSATHPRSCLSRAPRVL